MTTEPSTSFSQLGLPEAICQTLSKLGYEQPSSIQERSIPPLLENRDLLGVAQTGTGKTAAFALPLVSNIGVKESGPRALILTPTRELCIQVAEAIESYAESKRGLNVVPIYGGQEMGTQIRQLKRGAQIIVGTPGRVMDHIRRKTLKLGGIATVVLDEADEMLRMGFIEDVEWILDQTPGDRQLALFSATMPSAIKRIAEKYLQNPVEVRIESATKTVDRIEQTYIEVNNSRKLMALDLVLETEDFDAVIVFARTKTSAQELAQKLEIKGYKASSIHGDLNQRQRELCIRQLKDSVIDVVVATDVAARGIDVPRVTHVINYDIPYDGESYIHRIGRTGRAGRSGKAVLFVTQRERRMLKTIERTTGQPVAPNRLPNAGELKELRMNRFAQKISATLEKDSFTGLRESLSAVQQSTGLSFEDIALALCAQSQSGRSLAIEDRDLSMTGGKQMGGKKRRDRDQNQSDRKESEAGGRKSRAQRASELENVPMDTYKLDVGREHSVRVGDILGAVANELGIESRYIGEIKLEENTSFIALPKDMPKDLFQQFRKVRIRNYPAKPELQKSDGGSSANRRSENRKPGDGKAGKRTKKASGTAKRKGQERKDSRATRHEPRCKPAGKATGKAPRKPRKRKIEK